MPIQPKRYLEQGISHCGAYAVEGILSAYGEVVKEAPEQYQQSLLGRYLGSSTSRDLVRLLGNYGFKGIVGTAARLDDQEKMELLKQLLLEGTPVIMRIGNGYLENGEYNLMQGILMGHWITVWGYDDIEKVFYVYDSGIRKVQYDEVPIGNKKRTYQEILRDWSKSGLIQPWMWGKKNLYIKLSKL